MNIGDTFIDNRLSVPMSIRADGWMTLLQPLDVRTRIFNARLNLPDNHGVAWSIYDEFKTDGASIPRWLWFFIGPIVWWILIPAIIHDHLWRHNFVMAYVIDLETKKIVSKVGLLAVSDKEGNQIMLEKMAAFRGGLIKRNIVYYTLELVRLFR